MTQGEYYQFDPNVHYYYDEQGQLHYYDPNTNLDYDYQSQYAQQSTFYSQQVYTPQQHYVNSAYTDTSSSRLPTPDALLPCPDPTCNGENKQTSKFCEECGRSLGVISRSATPNTTTITRAFSTHQIKDNYPSRLPATPVYTNESNTFDQHYYNNTSNGYQYYQQQQPSAVDSLDRARGCPIVSFGFGGKMLVTFPRKVTNYYSSTVKPQAGPINVKSLKDYAKLSIQFPGPILLDPRVSTKQKKKDVVLYLNSMLNEFETQKLGIVFDSLEFHQLQSKILLYKVLKTMIETDGKVNDKDKMDQAILDVLRPVINNMDNAHFALPTFSKQDENVDLSDHMLTKIQTFLLNGDRKGAVEYTMQEDLWAHALIISSCVNKKLWQQVIQNFTTREMNCTPEMRINRKFNNITGNNQALRVIYALFSGVGATAMKEFLKTDVQYSIYTQQSIIPRADVSQLAKWRETLAIILANRTGRDLEAITTFGDIMKDQGWIKVAHICYLLSPQSSVHSGIDTLNNRLTLVGGESPSCLETIRLSEIYEFAQSLNNGTSTTCLPFLQGYKLAHAWTLADYGHTDMAQRYFESIEQCIKSYTKGSPYLHAHLSEQVNTLGLFLENMGGKKNGTDPASWLKPKFPKNGLSSLWGSLEGSLTKFVSGEEGSSQESSPPKKSTEIMSRYP